MSFARSTLWRKLILMVGLIAVPSGTTLAQVTSVPLSASQTAPSAAPSQPAIVLPAPAAPIPTGTQTTGTAAVNSGQAQSAQLPGPGNGVATPEASCLPEGRRTAADRIAAILVNPRILLSEHQMGGGGLTGEVRALVATSPALLEVIASLAPGASSQQKQAIGAGLASAAMACLDRRPDAANQIQTRVLSMGDNDTLMAFTSAVGPTATAASGFGGTGAGVGGGGGPSPSLGSGFAPGSYGGNSFQGVDVRSNSLFGAAVGSFGDSLSARSVSPSRP